jgi:DNA-binding transcriptional regulator YiaG
MSPADLRACLGRLGLSQLGAARLLGVDGRTVRKWVGGERGVPPPVVRLLWLCERLPEVRGLLGSSPRFVGSEEL